MDAQEWRETHAAYVEDYKASPKTYSDEVLLSVRLKRLGFFNSSLKEEIRFIKEN
jgi:hypothetical protein